MSQFIKTITPLAWRVIVFICAFVVISGVIGPRIISGGILFRDGFAIYGGLGKALIFGLIAFGFLARHHKDRGQLQLQAWQPRLLGWFVLSGIALAASWLAIDSLLSGQRDAHHLVVAHGGLLLGVACLAMGCLGLTNGRLLVRRYRQEIAVAVALGIGFYFFLLAVYALWPVLAAAVLYSVKALLEVSGLAVTIFLPYTLMLDKFGITIAEYCSGVESIALFSGLYAVVGLLDWKRLHRRRYFSLFPLALVLLFGLNILRVYGLTLAGYYINPELAFSLFHTYAGLVFFIIYSAAFWAIAYNYLVPKTKKSSS